MTEATGRLAVRGDLNQKQSGEKQKINRYALKQSWKVQLTWSKPKEETFRVSVPDLRNAAAEGSCSEINGEKFNR